MQFRILEQDLVLQVSPSYDINKLNLNKYEGFLDKLCGTREYQKEAIKQTLIYLIGGRYSSLNDLAKENFYNSETLKEKYETWEKYNKRLQLKEKMSCSIDLATGTGKSYVMYAIAQIMLCEGYIDKVLLLCPSITIEEALTKKFKSLSSDADLKSLLGSIDASFKNPRIIQAVETIQDGDICIENIHSTYKNTKSAIGDSMLGGGQRVLILNDEAHHIYSSPLKADKDLKKRHDFLVDEDFNFKYIVGFTGTAYIGNDYFADVIYRYSLTEGIEQKFIKSVNYIKNIEGKIDDIKRMEIIFQNHYEFQQKYFKIKPITIVISKDIEHCEKDRLSLIHYLVKTLKVSQEDAEKKVLIVTSHKNHKSNLDILKHVNEKHNPVEWICSVAMLSEGRDVPNVFQIVPSEEKAFNSKLLIAQVIGRGLRIPEEYKGEDVSVIVMNHKKFSASIDHLVDELLEKEEKIYTYPVSQKKEYIFPLYNIVYDTTQYEEEKENLLPMSYERAKKEGFNLPSSLDEDEISITLGVRGNTEETIKKYTVHEEILAIEDVTLKIHNIFQSWDIEQGTDYADKYDFDTIKAIIIKSLKKAGIDHITKIIETRLLKSFGTFKRFGTKNVRYKNDPVDINKIEVGNTKKTGVNISTIKKGSAQVFYDEFSFKYSDITDIDLLKFLKDEVPPKCLIEIKNSYLFKTPFNILITGSAPEKQFVDMLLNEKYSSIIDGFIKSKDRGLYEFEYRRTKGAHMKTENFNPDFFIRSGNKILVIEIKGKEAEKSTSMTYIKNKAKYFQATEHFTKLNALLQTKGINQEYYFHFCAPNDYRTLLEYLKRGNIKQYISNLEHAFTKNEGEEIIYLQDKDVKALEQFDSREFIDDFGSSRNKLEENSQLFLLTAESNYQMNLLNKKNDFLSGHLAKTFELEIKTKFFSDMREQEDIRAKIIADEENRKGKDRNEKLIKFFQYTSDLLDLGAMEVALKYNSYVKEFIEGKNSLTYRMITEYIGVIRSEYRNKSQHGDELTTQSKFENLRNLLLIKEALLKQIIEF